MFKEAQNTPISRLFVSKQSAPLITITLIAGFLTFINAYDVRFTTRVQNVFMFTKILALVIIIVGGIVWMAGGNQ